jgi:hypothetical protein
MQTELKGLTLLEREKARERESESGRILIRGSNPRSLQLLGGKGGVWVSSLVLLNEIVWSGGLPHPHPLTGTTTSLLFRLAVYLILHHHFKRTLSLSFLYFVHPSSLALFLSCCNK